MIGPAPKFIESPYFVDEPGNWHLKPGAPKEVVDEFNEFMKSFEPTIDMDPDMDIIEESDE